MWGKTVFEPWSARSAACIPRLYDEQVVAALRKVWYLFGCLGGKRLVAVLRAQVPLLEKFGELDLDDPASSSA